MKVLKNNTIKWTCIPYIYSYIVMAIWRVESQTSKITPNLKTMFWKPQINSNWTTWYIIGKSQDFLLKLSILIWNEKSYALKIVRLIISHFWKFSFWVFSKVCHSNETLMGSYKLYYMEEGEASFQVHVVLNLVNPS